MVNHKYRFKTDTSNGATITNLNLFTAAGCVVIAANTTASSFFMSVKINSIEVWSLPEVGVTSTCSIVWLGTSSATGLAQQEVSDISLTPNYPAHLITRPPRKSFASEWFGTGSSVNLFTLAIDGAGIVDVSLSLLLSDANISSAPTLTIGSGAEGAVIYGSLDGTTDKFTPVGLTTTT